MAKLIFTASQTNNQYTQITAKTISIYQFQQLKNLADNCEKEIQDLSLIDFIIFYQIPLELFSGALDLLFHQFYLKKILS
ncbi:hypothetical protein ACQ86K_26670 [Mucilaginibacter sp. P19]|uniref:hypothetical protein n=1 Tax=Mucilaginibacter sp. P19 TaxID=3423947 RepID=UPI003D66DE6D